MKAGCVFAMSCKSKPFGTIWRWSSGRRPRHFSATSGEMAMTWRLGKRFATSRTKKKGKRKSRSWSKIGRRQSAGRRRAERMQFAWTRPGLKFATVSSKSGTKARLSCQYCHSPLRLAGQCRAVNIRHGNAASRVFSTRPSAANNNGEQPLSGSFETSDQKLFCAPPVKGAQSRRRMLSWLFTFGWWKLMDNANKMMFLSR